MFFIFEGTLFILFIFAFIIDQANKNSGRVVKRGDKSKKIITRFSSVIISYLVLQIITNTEILKEYRVILIITNLSLVVYLCFFNNWFRNKIIGFYIKIENRMEFL